MHPGTVLYLPIYQLPSQLAARLGSKQWDPEATLHFVQMGVPQEHRVTCPLCVVTESSTGKSLLEVIVLSNV